MMNVEPGIPNIMSQEMLRQAGYTVIDRSESSAKEEFLAIFYKELLKQTFKAPKLGVSEENNSFSGMFGSDLLVEKLAMELARSNSFSFERNIAVK